jgi:hypothetical protein
MVAQATGPGGARLSASTLETLWSRLAAAGLTTGEMPTASASHTPWYVRVMLCIAGLIAAGFLLGFVGAGFAFIVQSKTASAALGFGLMTAAYALFRAAPRSDFGSMFALAISFAGQALFIYGFFGLFERGASGTAYFLIAAIETALAIVMPNVIHRFASAYAAALALAFGLASTGMSFIAAGLIGTAVAVVWLNEARLARWHAIAVPIGYGLTVAFIQMEGTILLGHELLMHMAGSTAPQRPWLGEALVTVNLIATIATLVKRAAWRWSEARTVFSFVAVVAIGAASFKAPGVAGGLMIVVLGYANGNRVLAGLGVAALLFYVSAYYYQLDVTLLVKSGVLAATGAVLLAARWLMLKVLMPEDAGHA